MIVNWVGNLVSTERACPMGFPLDFLLTPRLLRLGSGGARRWKTLIRSWCPVLSDAPIGVRTTQSLAACEASLAPSSGLRPVNTHSNASGG